MENNGIGKLCEGVDRWTVLIYVLIVLVGPALLRLLRRSARPAEFTPGFEPSQQGPERTE